MLKPASVMLIARIAPPKASKAVEKKLANATGPLRGLRRITAYNFHRVLKYDKGFTPLKDLGRIAA